MFSHEYTCDRCNLTATYVSTEIGYYRLADGTDIPRLSQPAWCNYCNALRSAERLPELERLQQILAEIESAGLSDGDYDFLESLQQSPESYLAERVSKWRASVRWRSQRQSPPRCLECESTDLELLAQEIDQSLESLPHPNCGGNFTRTNWWHCSQACYTVLDSEGRGIVGGPSAT
ncbi:MAG: hypothetical protein KDB00_16435 [Planctomycetales bacterium]|nr:hypothetical protein [Planctomycetales bacterium]